MLLLSHVRNREREREGGREGGREVGREREIWEKVRLRKIMAKYNYGKDAWENCYGNCITNHATKLKRNKSQIVC